MTQMIPFDYSQLLRQVKQRVSQAQQRAIYTANEELLRMYWDIGEMLSSAQKLEGWGNGTLERLATDINNLYPEVMGFSPRNCRFMIQFFEEYNKELTMVKSITQPPVAQLETNTKPLVSQLQSNMKPPVSQLPKYNFELPIKHLSWSHNILLIQQVKDIRSRYWYMTQCVVNHWSRRYLAETIKLDYYNQHGALANNFDTTLPTVESDDVKSMLKDPYKFKPEYIGKLNFYCSAVDDILCREGDNKTIGLLLCRTKDRIKAEYALRDIAKPIGVSDYELGQALPSDLRSSLPSIEEIEAELK